jgi:glycine betaine/proline transport system substrate-binding protein
MKFIKTMILSLALATGVTFASFSANAACNVKVGDFDWDSANIHAAIGSYIMQHGYDCNVEVTKGSTNPILAALIDGQLDIIFEHWTDNNVLLIDPLVASGLLVDLGINTPASEQAFFVDRTTSEAYGITDVQDLKKPGIWELFKDPENPSKGRITSCISGWSCYTVNQVKLLEYGLADLYTNFDPGSGGALDAAIAGAFAKGQPIVTYYWTPTSLMGKSEIDLVRLTEPAYEKACWDAMMVVVDNMKANGMDAYVPSCANEYKDMALTKLATGKFAAANPDLIEFASQYSMSTAKVNEMLAYYVDESDGDMEATAMFFLETTSEWESWVPSDVASKIKNSL